MTAVTVPTGRAVSKPTWLMPVCVLVGAAVVLAQTGVEVPSWLDAGVEPWVQARYKWTVVHDDHWIFTWLFHPIGESLQSTYDFVIWCLRALRWPGVLTLAGVIGALTSGWRAALTGVVMFFLCGVIADWDNTVITTSIMIVAVIVSLLIGIPLGIWSSRSLRVEAGLRGLLDTAQVMPVYVYLMPIVVLFGIGTPAVVVATVVFAVPPAVRLTNLGLRSVSTVTQEVGRSFGATQTQLLRKVQLPMASRTILLGMNQVIMMAYGVVAIAALVGSGGLGQDVLTGLQKIDVGKTFAPGLALVFSAIALDRITTGRPRVGGRRRFTLPAAMRDARTAIPIGCACVVIVGIVSTIAGADNFPDALTFSIEDHVNSAADWVKDHFRTGVPLVGGTQSFSDFFVMHVLDPMRDLLLDSPWWLIVVVFSAIGWASGGWRLAMICSVSFVGIAALGVTPDSGEPIWDKSMETLSQVLIAVVLSLLIALPLGLIAGRSDRVDRLLRPFLDTAQVLPAFCYLVPVLFLFNVGRTPGVIASVIYAVPPCIRLTSLGLRSVPTAPREAATSFGATGRQELLRVQIPLAARSVMLGINQTILMVLSMVIIAALVGAGGLGLEAIYGLTKKQVGRGFVGGLAIVLLAVVLDRITQAWGRPRSTRAIG
jgi:glycine betaine/proline transport system permease protein